MKEKIQEVIDNEINPLLAQHGGGCTLVSVEDGVVKLSFQGGCAGCPSRSITLLNGVIPIIRKRVPEVKNVVLSN